MSPFNRNPVKSPSSSLLSHGVLATKNRAKSGMGRPNYS